MEQLREQGGGPGSTKREQGREMAPFSTARLVGRCQNPSSLIAQSAYCPQPGEQKGRGKRTGNSLEKTETEG
jgi:hypothetical protein